MLVKERMSQPVFTALPEMPLQEAANLMREKGIRRLPVVDDGGSLVGIVTESDLLHASPSDATSLSIWELNYLLSKVAVKELMSSPVVTVQGDTNVREAANIMVTRKFGGLPVMDGENVIGIITETDLFKTLVDLLEE